MVDIHTTGPRESPFDHNSIKDGPMKSSLYQNRINNTTNIIANNNRLTTICTIENSPSEGLFGNLHIYHTPPYFWLYKEDTSLILDIYHRIYHLGWWRNIIFSRSRYFAALRNVYPSSQSCSNHPKIKK